MEITKLNLEELYLQQGKSIKQIAQYFDNSTASISRLLKKHEIPTRPFSTKGMVGWNKGIPMSQKTKANLSKAHLGKKLSKEHREKVIKSLNYGQIGAKNHMWKEGIFVNPKGYIYLRIPTHPNVQSNGYVAEHRFVMEQKLGRYLTHWEHVHHINRIKHDNRPENLELVNGQTHNLITMLENRVIKLEAENELLRKQLTIKP